MHRELQLIIEAAYSSKAKQKFIDFLKEGFKLNAEDRFLVYDIALTPYHHLVAQWVDDPDVDWIYLIQGSQTSKTTLQMGFGIWCSKEPNRLLWVQSTEDEAKNFVTERLKPYIEGFDPETIKRGNWKNEAFRVFNARWKIGFATTENSLKSVPCKYIVGDECAGWKIPVSYPKKRTKTFEGKGRKGLFATTPPRSGEHHSWKSAKNSDFYRWFVPCPTCNHFQPMVLKNLIWDGRKEDGTWDEKEVRETARFQCEKCLDFWSEDQKYTIISRGRGVCVDPEKDFEVTEDKGRRSKAIQIPSFYSMFTTWGQLAMDFLDAKKEGREALEIYITDELAETIEQKDQENSLDENVLAQFIDPSRDFGIQQGEYHLITCGVDVQRRGELFVVLMGWKGGLVISGHVLDFGIVRWKDERTNAEYWEDYIDYLNPYLPYLHRVAMDSSDGEESQKIYDFCNYQGDPFVALKDGGAKPTLKYKYTYHTPKEELKKRAPKSQRLLLVNSAKIKNDIQSAFERAPDDEGSWSFPAQTSDRFLKSLTKEFKTFDKDGKTVWKLKYSNAWNHYFSAMVYATAAMEDRRTRLQASNPTAQKVMVKKDQQQKTIQQININTNFEKGLSTLGL